MENIAGILGIVSGMRLQLKNRQANLTLPWVGSKSKPICVSACLPVDVMTVWQRKVKRNTSGSGKNHIRLDEIACKIV